MHEVKGGMQVARPGLGDILVDVGCVTRWGSGEFGDGDVAAGEAVRCGFGNLVCADEIAEPCSYYLFRRVFI